MFNKRQPQDLELPTELADLERQLAAAEPTALRTDRDRLMFAAGQAAATARVALPARWLWPAATVMMTAASLLLAAMLVQQHDAERVAASNVDVPQPAVVEIEPVAPVTLAVNRDAWPWISQPTLGYLGLRHTALTQGVGALDLRQPDVVNGTIELSPPATARELLNELLPQSSQTSS